MKVVVASRNPVKVGATTQAFKTLFPDAILEVTSVNVDSGAGDQPDSDEATRQGARVRALRSREAIPDADFWVGLEGGIEIIDNQLMAFAWMAVQARVGDVSEARSTTLPLPPAVMKLVVGGLELGEANDRVFSTVNSKQGGGAYGLLTDGLYTREGIYAQTLIMALIPFVNSLYPQSEALQEGRGRA
jgi:inosine/xanthosine triphosphatase